MGNDFSRRVFLGSLSGFLTVGTGTLAAPPATSLRPHQRGEGFHKRGVPSAQDIINAEKLSGRVAFAVADAKSGKWLECENEQTGTAPASVTKALTALYALETLGAAHQFETTLCATGGVINGEVQGDLVLVGGGDPTLDTDGLALMAAQLKEASIIGVKGGFKVFEAAFPVLRQIDPSQPDQVGYNPAVSGLALNFNRVHFEWKRGSNGYAVTMEGRSERYRPAVTMAAMQIRDRRAPIYTYEDHPSRDSWTVAKGALGKSGARWLPVRKPGLYAGDVFATMAGAQGIRLAKPEVIDVLPQGETIVTHQSGPLLGILQDMLKYSTNLTAEMVGLAATKRRIGLAPDLQSSAAEMNRWAMDDLGLNAPKLVDHSGLGDASRVTAQDLALALIKVHNSTLRGILKPFKMRDKKGRPIKDHPVTVDAKTGTLNFVSGLAGYVTAKNGRVLAFAVFAADEDARAKILPDERERAPGAKTWNRKAKRTQQGLIERWAVLYGT